MEWLKRKYFGEMAKVEAEIQAINIWIDSARTSYLANRRYREWKPMLKALARLHRALQRKYEGGQQCTSRR